ncbi:MAG: rod shape-determining protein MreC [Pseudomonadota bacterium]
MAFAVTGRQQDRKNGGLLPRLLRYGIYVVLIGLIALSVIAPTRLDTSRLAAQQAAAPLVWIYETPVETVRGVVRYIADYLTVHADNRRLNKQLVDSDYALRRLEQLELENEALRQQLKATSWPAQVVATGRVLSHGGGTYLKSMLIAAGSEDGVKNGQAAVTSAGLVGQVVAVSGRLSRVLMINDFSSRVPILVNETSTPGIIEGTNKSYAALSFLPIDFAGRAGAFVSTSGAGGLFPAGLPVGQLVILNEGTPQQAYRVQPFAKLEAAGYVTFLSAPDAAEPAASPLPDQLARQVVVPEIGGG